MAAAYAARILAGTKLRSIPAASIFRRSCIPSNSKHISLVDTLALAKQLEAQGVPVKHAEAVTEALNDSVQNISEHFVSTYKMKEIEMKRDANEMKRDANFLEFKAKVESSQEKHFSLLQLEIEKLRSDIKKIRSESRNDTEKLRYEIDKVIVSISAQLREAKYDVIKYCIG